MATFVAIVVEVRREPFLTIGSGGVLLEVDLLVFYSSPQTLDHHIVDRAALAIHVDRDVLGHQRAREFPARELRTLVRVEDLRPDERQRLPATVRIF